MKRLAVLCVVVVAVALVVPAQAQTTRKTVMVVDFGDQVHGWSSTSEVVTMRVISKLRDEQSLRILPRDRVQQALRDARIETSGMLDWEDAQKVAKGLEANYVVMGDITAFDQQQQSVWVIVAYATKVTARVSLRGKILDVATGQFVGDPKADVTKELNSGSAWVGPWWGHVSVDNFDAQLIGKATIEAIEQFVNTAKPTLMK